MYLVYESWFDKIRRGYFQTVLDRYHITAGKKLLDYGCGPGDMIVIAKQAGIKAEGLDLAPRSVLLAKERGIQIKLGDYRQMNRNYKKNSFDVIFLQSVIEHIHQPIEELTEIIKYLKPQGLLILSSPTPGNFFWDDPTHVRPYTPKSFSILGELLELKVLEVNYVFAFLLGFKMTWPIIYMIMNLLPISLGSNLIAVYQKTK